MRWIWIDKFVAFERGRQATAIKNVSRAEEHLHDLYPAYPQMPGSLVVEGMAQTAGILVGHAREFSERVILAKIKKAALGPPAVPGDQLAYHAVLDHIDEAGAMTSGTVTCNGAPWGQIDLVFSHLDRASGAALGIPEHNFVFTGDFERLVATCPDAGS